MIPAGTAIVALSEARIVSATTLPKILEITTFLPAAPWISTIPLPPITLTPAAPSATDSLEVGSPAVIVNFMALFLSVPQANLSLRPYK